ncbi:MAG: hypothetical protein SYC29_11300 [Planctomycetota bacterium]|nr:hypothetical protein [Planctomycetota bacterium]
MPDAHATCGFAPLLTGSSPTGAPLIAALEGPQREHALEQAMKRLHAAGDVHLLLAMIKALLRLGLAGLALRLLHSTRVPRPMQNDLRDLADELAALPSGETPLAGLADRYRAHASILHARWPHLRDVIPASPPDLDDVHLFITPAGNTHAVRDDPAGRLHFLFPFVDHHRQAARFEPGPVREGSAVRALGVPPPPLLMRLFALHTDSDFRPPIDIIEPDPRVFALWLHLADMARLFDDVRITPFVGPDALGQYERFRAAHLWRPEPTLTLKNHRPDWRADAAPGDVRTLDQRVRSAVRTRQQALFDRQAARWASCSPASWARRFRAATRGGPPLRVLALATRYSTVTRHAMRDLAAAFRRRNCHADVVTEPHDCSSRIDTWSLLADESYDLIVVLNHLRAPLADQIHPNVPYVCWIQDHMPELWTRSAGRSIGELDLVIGRDRGVLTTLHDYPADRFLPAGNLTDPVTYSAEPLGEDESARFRCDVSYISHASATPDRMIDDIAARNAPATAACLRRVLALMRRRVAESGFVSLIDTYAIMLQAEREGGDVSFTRAERNTRMHPVVLALFDRLFRHEALEWVAEWAAARGRSFRLFGRGWERHPTLHRFACGELANGRGLRCAAQASRINLQINGYGSLHQRLLDSLASGGFVLTRYNPHDFIRPPMLELRRIIESRDITSLSQLVDPAGPAPEAAAHLETLRRLRQPSVAPADDPLRRREVDLMYDVGGFPRDKLTDEAFLESLRSQRYLPHRLAGDIPGFTRTTFADRGALHDMLDHYVDDDAARRELSEMMRRDVLDHDTYDSLVRRITRHFTCLPSSRPARAGAATAPKTTGGVT